MKALIHGTWHPAVDDTAAYAAARAAQPDSLFRSWVNADPAAAFPAAAERYHLYVSYACPFAHRTILYRALLGLEDVLPMSVAHPRWSGPDGWTFTVHDPLPIRSGAPGLYGFTPVDGYFDNVKITESD